MGEFATDMYLLATAYNALQKMELTGLVRTPGVSLDLTYLQTQILDELQAWAIHRRRGVQKNDAKKSKA